MGVLKGTSTPDPPAFDGAEEAEEDDEERMSTRREANGDRDEDDPVAQREGIADIIRSTPLKAGDTWYDSCGIFYF